MPNLRTYGNPPFHIAVIHGGPGAAGEMAPVARELSETCGFIEPLQTAASVEGQINELKEILETNAALPAILAGFSWGAWLSFIFAARYPDLVKKLILISSGPFEESYAYEVHATRMGRLSAEEQAEVKTLMDHFNGAEPGLGARDFERFGEILSKADAYDPLLDDSGIDEKVEFRPDIFQSVWKEAAELRRSGKLLELAKDIHCPVAAIHGDDDPHPAEGVWKPLADRVKDFNFFLIPECGHRPWMERRARSKFFEILKEELGLQDKRKRGKR